MGLLLVKISSNESLFLQGHEATILFSKLATLKTSHSRLYALIELHVDAPILHNMPTSLKRNQTCSGAMKQSHASCRWPEEYSKFFGHPSTKIAHHAGGQRNIQNSLDIHQPK
jgi:hypothetical protein